MFLYFLSQLKNLFNFAQILCTMLPLIGLSLIDNIQKIFKKKQKVSESLLGNLIC